MPTLAFGYEVHVVGLPCATHFPTAAGLGLRSPGAGLTSA